MHSPGAMCAVMQREEVKLTMPARPAAGGIPGIGGMPRAPPAAGPFLAVARLTLMGLPEMSMPPISFSARFRCSSLLKRTKP